MFATACCTPHLCPGAKTSCCHTGELFVLQRYQRNGCCEVAVVAYAYFTQLTIQFGNVRSLSSIMSRLQILSCTGCSDRCIYRGIWAIQNKALRTGGLVLEARCRCDRQDYDALEAALQCLELAACLADSFFRCEPVCMLDSIATYSIDTYLPARKFDIPSSLESISCGGPNRCQK